MEELEESKLALRGLNGRLKGFLEHVNQLERTNRELEEQITEWRLRNVAPWRDWSDKEALTQELQAQVTMIIIENAEVLLQCDAVKLRAAHLKTRCETEKKLRLVKEQEVSQLKIKKTEVETSNTLLEKQLYEYQNELPQIMEKHEVETLRELDQQQRRAVEECDRVLAQVAAGEDGRGMDLSRTSTQCDHSSPAQSSPDSATPPNPAPVSGPASQRRPQKDATSPTALFPPQVRAGDEALKEARAELAEARKRWHRLQVEIESLHALERSLHSSLHHTQLQYSVQLKDLSRSVRCLESELETVRDGLEIQKQNHTQLLNTKMRLEREIATYRKLLEHEEGRFLNSDGRPLKLKPWKVSVPAPEQNGLTNGCDEDISEPFFTGRTPKISPALQQQQGLLILTEPVINKDGEICTVKTQEILEGNVVRESAEGHGNVETEKIDKVIRQWEGSFFKGNPKLRKKSVSLRFNLHMAVADEGCSQIKQDSLPNVEVRLVMRRSRSIPTFAQCNATTSQL
ncbi:keratin, type I cytoskeletal 19-like isoform X1 [Cyprinus carpio]|uniref:Keratin, type I cytoskeletal 19-like isoform X1 n=1 Tax=Cyprinus carpio TaxID=7962 RepID=A0A9Q9VNK7_CYPCA|nr:keratin, type I cytoskeletal 19-like isoform X1 [Cyprinus carpio]XP_042568322.1 keratin, type I cytoskeletal 19-like isoform X1 [Cyprinus carpio]XP_042568323.1 keratin, type I cytoskeletal 19-like isoform X1 [Cyprinus carpio]XP_042568324.1 keratin, type I cytoskeletal 19-like isoform X1 [Cyprinus carpio]